MSNPLVSVIIPTFNPGGVVARAIDSVLERESLLDDRVRRLLQRDLRSVRRKLRAERWLARGGILAALGARGCFEFAVRRDEKALAEHTQRQERDERWLDQMNLFDWPGL